MTDADPARRDIYQVAAVAALGIAILTPLAIAAFIAWPPPYDGTVLDWYELFDESPLIGLVSMDLLLIGVLVLEIPVFVALYAAFEGSNRWLIGMAVVTAFIGVSLQLSSITAFEMLALAEDYAVAAGDTERKRLLAAGEAALATYEGTAFQLNYFLGGTVVPLIVSAVMLRGIEFPRPVAYVGVFAAVMNLGLYVPEIGLYLSVLAGAAYWVWFILLARRFRQLALKTAIAP